ncbi:LANO_0G05204g1_1 [Lachancea nothofagi CBS 11611]|uniref:Dynein heavy chain, cytoplasmic n=1 Tax=Lachancea nothofagi CBS 11611 TaxID=1266666 RepID=A0A1G4KGT3_9SACH|nr:LANO_0G05204g1_1 [Lachancea nothofagi CBS 11611]
MYSKRDAIESTDAIFVTEISKHCFKVAVGLFSVDSEQCQFEKFSELNTTTIAIFAADQDVRALVLRKLEDGSILASIYAENEPKHMERDAILVTIVKSALALDPNVAIENQTFVLSTSHDMPLTAFSSLITTGMSSLFEHAVSSGRLIEANESSVHDMRSKIKGFSELLKNVKTLVVTPDLLSAVHPLVRQIVAEGATVDNTSSFISEDQLKDSSFLNTLQTTVISWTNSLQVLTALTRKVEDGTSSDEILFWRDLESALISAQEQVRAPATQLTILILQEARRLQTTFLLVSDSVLTKRLKEVKLYNQFLTELPTAELQAANSLEELRNALTGLSFGLKRIKSFNYPIPRVQALVGLLAAEFILKIKSLPSTLNTMEHADFEHAVDSLESLLHKWDDIIQDLTLVLREVTRKRSEKFVTVKLNSHTENLKSRINEIKVLRNSSCLLMNDVLKAGLTKYAYFVSDAFEPLLSIDCLKCPADRWRVVKDTCTQRVCSLEMKISGNLRFNLNSCVSTGEMFSVLECFGPLLERPRLRVGLQDYNEILLNSVLADLSRLQQRLSDQLTDLQVSRLKNLPPISSNVMRNQSVKKRIMAIMSKLTLLLGVEWNRTEEGSVVFKECNLMLENMNDNKTVKNWLSCAASKQNVFEKPIFEVQKEGTEYHLRVTSDQLFYNSFKEVRNLKWMGYDVPRTSEKFAASIRTIYPKAVQLGELVHTFTSIAKRVNERPFLNSLLSDHVQEALKLLRQSVGVKWNVFTLKLSTPTVLHDSKSGEGFDKPMSLTRFQSLCSEIIRAYDEMEGLDELLISALRSLSGEKYSVQALKSWLQQISCLKERLRSHNLGNSCRFQNLLDSAVENSLLEVADRALRSNELPQQFHTISIENGSVMTSPPLQRTKTVWMRHVQFIFENTIYLLNIFWESSEIDHIIKAKIGCFTRKISVLMGESLKEQRSVLITGCSMIDMWKKYETLWKVSEEELLGCTMDLSHCYSIYSDLRNDKKVINTMRSKLKIADSLSFSIQQIKSDVQNMLQNWEKVLLQRMIFLYTRYSYTFHQELIECRQFLEAKNVSIEAISLEDLHEMIATIDQYQKTWNVTEENLVLFHSVNKLIADEILASTCKAVPIDQLEMEVKSMKQILEKRSAWIKERSPIVSNRLDMWYASITESSISLENKWKTNKPVSSEMTPSCALAVIQSIENAAKDLKIRFKKLNEISRILFLATRDHDLLVDVVSDIADHRLAWEAISAKWITLQQIKDKKWTDIELPEVKQQLNELKKEQHKITNQLVLGSFFTQIRFILSSYKKLEELKDQSLRPRHWASIFEECNAALTFKNREVSDITLGDVLSLNVNSNEHAISRVLREANSEAVLEAALSTIGEHWKETKFKQTQHASGLLIVKEWKYLFEMISDDMETLSSMKNSTHHNPFEQQSLSWDLKLNQMAAILTDWAEAQKYWLHLHGVLSHNNNADFLRPETTKFESVSSNFTSLLSRVLQSDVVLDILNVRDCHKLLKLIVDSLKKIMSSLNEYLETQREKFPRLYFLGNEDLLQLMGAPRNLKEASRHLNKLYSGVSGFIFDDSLVIGVRSQENESLEFQTPLKMDDHREMKDWLEELDSSIKTTVLTATETCLKRLKLDGFKFFGQVFEQFSFQALLLAIQIRWTSIIDDSSHMDDFSSTLSEVHSVLDILVSLTQSSKCLLRRRKAESLIVECIHTQSLLQRMAYSDLHVRESVWGNTLKYYYDSTAPKWERINVRVGNHSFCHGLEYIGVPERLIYTPLLENCFTAMAHALAQKRGGSPFGPAGTGKTETIKAFGQNLGRMVLVFNCDESFDFQSMGRLLFGIAQVGAWGCFDEFNRLDESIMSAVASQIGEVQDALSEGKSGFCLLGKSASLNSNTGVFVTMNHGYRGRRELPDNLRKKFRQFSMKKPEIVIIAEVILATLGFKEAKQMALRISNFLKELQSLCSKQKHYDFGLRAMKGILRNCRTLRLALREASFEDVLFQSLHQLLAPRLIEADEIVFREVSSRVFPSVEFRIFDEHFKSCFEEICLDQGLTATDTFIQKCSQFFHIQKSQQAIIISGRPGSGKTNVWNTTLRCMKLMSGIDNIVYIIDSKVLSKSELYGSLDPVTFEWSDGLFTSILRQITQDSVGKFRDARLWIAFDGDLDPDYVETINSVLDDNKVFTLPNGERLNIPPHLSFIFEVEKLEVATPATISRCAVIVLNRPTCFPSAMLQHSLVNSIDKMAIKSRVGEQRATELCKILTDTFGHTLNDLYTIAESLPKTIDSTLNGAVEMFVSLTCSQVLQNFGATEATSKNSFENFVKTSSYINITWAMVGSCDQENRYIFETRLRELLSIPTSSIAAGASITDYCMQPGDKSPTSLSKYVPYVSLEPHEVLSPDLMIATIDTIKHERLIFDLLYAGKSPILCGPPGSGKTMTLYNSLKKSKKFDLVGLTFSKETSVNTFQKTLKHHTSLIENAKEIVMRPKSLTKNLVIFCDEINLPRADDYGEQPVILFLRQILEKEGFWDVEKHKWVRLERIRIVGACNPPDGKTRKEFSKRFTRLTPILSVAYPGKDSMLHIYETFFKAILKLTPDFREYYKEFAHASVEVYYRCRQQFTMERHIHYVYSPRDLTRWIKGVYFILTNSSIKTLSQLIEIWIYEGLRLFSDRLVESSDIIAFEEIIEDIVSKFLPNQLQGHYAMKDILLSNWVTTEYQKTTRLELASFVNERLKTFEEEELECSLIVHDNLIDHMVRVDRALKQEQGHCILVGPSRSAKRSLVRFVSWINGMEVMQLIVHRNFHIMDFDRMLRSVMIKCAVGQQKVVLMVDDSSILESSFIERMNTLLANSDVPGLFEAEERAKLIAELSQKSEQLGLLLDGEDELYAWFTELISRNLHVIFTINDPESPSAVNVINSPALFNRCVLNWVGHWSDRTFTQIGKHYVEWMPLEHKSNRQISTEAVNHKGNISNLLVDIAIQTFKKYQSVQSEPVTPGKFLDHLVEFQEVYADKSSKLELSQRFIATGVDTLKETVLRVKDLSAELLVKEEMLKQKEQEARSTLDTMLFTQNEAERKHEATVGIRKILEVQEKELTSRRAQIVKDLALVEPEILEAQRGVNNIKKQHMTEIRSMFNPPNNVKLTLEAVCIILGQSLKEWKDIQQFVRKDEFISSIVHYDTNKMMNASTRSFVEREYLSKPNFNFHAVNHSSKACGPLFQWIVAQVKYSSMLTTVIPLKNGVAQIEQEMLQTKARLLAAEDMIIDYQKIVEDSKQEYSDIIREKEFIKTELHQVQQKVSRSEKLVKSLASEKLRWSDSISTFDESKNSLVGDCFLSSLYVTYCIGHNENMRRDLTNYAKSLLGSNDIEFEYNYSFNNHVIDFQERSDWVSKALPDENSCIENFYKILKGPQYPFVIDPEGRVAEAIQNYFGSCLTVTSFLDNGFVKRLINALRFGGKIMIQDGDYFDPIISLLIAKEFKKVGGKDTVTIGDSNIDIAPDFKLIISTKNARCRISSFVRARMAIVDFAIDKDSLESQSLEHVLAQERPELYKQRKELNMLNGKYRLRLNSLEQQLLEALNGSECGLLENDALISTLEKLKVQATEVEVKIKETKGVIEKVDLAVSEYKILSYHALKLYSFIERLAVLHWSYHISIVTFLECQKSIFNEILPSNANRPQQLLLAFYKKVFEIVSTGMSEDHRSAFVVLLFISFFESEGSRSLNDATKEFMMAIRDEPSADTLHSLLNNEGFAFDQTVVLEFVQELRQAISTRSIHSALLTSEKFLQGTKPSSLYDLLSKWSNSPILLVSERGTDGTYRISQLASQMSRNLSIVSLGSLESTVMAETALSSCSQSGDWLLLQNLQMSADWVQSVLTRRLETMLKEPHTSSNFHVFLTCELEGNPLPPPLVQSSWHLVHEGKRGVLETANDIWSTLSHLPPVSPPEKLYIYFLLVWYHALLVESSRLAPLAFTRKYDFSDADFAAGIYYLDTLFSWFESTERGFDHEVIPWVALRFNIGTIIYGGKIDDEKDLELCTNLASNIFREDALNAGFEIMPGVLAPEKTHEWGSFQKWLSDCQPLENCLQLLGSVQDVENGEQKVRTQKIADYVVQLLDDY